MLQASSGFGKKYHSTYCGSGGRESAWVVEKAFSLVEAGQEATIHSEDDKLQRLVHQKCREAKVLL